MEIIVFSAPEFIENEVELIHQLFENRLQLFHLRKPNADKATLEYFLKKIAPKYLKRVVIHSHYELIKKYNLKGIHLTEAERTNKSIDELKLIVKTLQSKGLTISTGFHSLNELIEFKKILFDYVFLSPIFNSISKENYQSTFDLVEIADFIKNNVNANKIYALGGINEFNIDQVKAIGFKKSAILGAFWLADNPIETYIKLKLLSEK